MNIFFITLSVRAGYFSFTELSLLIWKTDQNEYFFLGAEVHFLLHIEIRQSSVLPSWISTSKCYNGLKPDHGRIHATVISAGCIPLTMRQAKMVMIILFLTSVISSGKA